MAVLMLLMKPKSLIELIKKYKIDTTRIYVTGLSAGGKGAMKALGFFPDFFAAGVVICPADSGNRDYQIKAPVWLFANEFDNIIPEARTEYIYNNLKRLNQIYVDKTVYKGVVGHNAWDQTYDNQNVWKWLFAQKKRPPLNISPTINDLFAQRKLIDYKIDSLLNGAKIIR
jgi:predicted peptidase